MGLGEIKYTVCYERGGFSHLCLSLMGTAVAQWLRCCATKPKVAGSIPVFRKHYGPGVDSASNRNEYQEYFLGIKAAGA